MNVTEVTITDTAITVVEETDRISEGEQVHRGHTIVDPDTDFLVMENQSLAAVINEQLGDGAVSNTDLPTNPNDRIRDAGSLEELKETLIGDGRPGSSRRTKTRDPGDLT